MRRREFISLVGGAAAAWPLAARAQQSERMRRIGVLMAVPEHDPEYQAYIGTFRAGLQKLGWTEGRNIQIDYRWGADDLEAMQRVAKDLVALQPDLILTQNTPTTAATLHQTRAIPILFANCADPVGSGSLRLCRGLGATSPVSSRWSRRWPASGSNCPRSSHRASIPSPPCPTRQRRL